MTERGGVDEEFIPLSSRGGMEKEWGALRMGGGEGQGGRVLQRDECFFYVGCMYSEPEDR